MNSWCICWFSLHIFTGILVFKGLPGRRLYKLFGVKRLAVCLIGRSSQLQYLLQGNYRTVCRSVTTVRDAINCPQDLLNAPSFAGDITLPIGRLTEEAVEAGNRISG
jgi:hypothetical protein